MIDKMPETTTLECTLPKAALERLTSWAATRDQTIDEALSDAIEQSCERWTQEEALGPAEGDFSGMDIPRKQGTPVEVTRVVKRWPERMSIDDDGLAAPFTLPLTNPQPIEVHPGPPHRPDPIAPEED